MRNLSANALTTIARKLGNESIVIIEIDWGAGGSPLSYADRDVEGIPGRILEVGALDNVIDVQSSNSSQQLTITLDDTDGHIKAILSEQDVHQCTVRVYQWFEGLDLADKFLLVSGKINSPITWSEADRTFSFTIITQIEDREFGFSAEEGDFEFIPAELIGKPWPVVFGTVREMPATHISKVRNGTILCGVGIVSGLDFHPQVPLGGDDCSLGQSLAVMSAQISFLSICATKWEMHDPEKAAELRDQANEVRRSRAEAAASRNTQRVCAQNIRTQKVDDAQNHGTGCNPVRILGGEDFPQGQAITLDIGGGYFTGIMNGDVFTIIGRRHPDHDRLVNDRFEAIQDEQCETPPTAQYYDFQMQVPPEPGPTPGVYRMKGMVICPRPTTSRPSKNQVAEQFWAEPGTTVSLIGDDEQHYIVSITPGTVLGVSAYKRFGNRRTLIRVPNDLWRVETKTYGPITVVTVVVSRQLSGIEGQNWEDDIYIDYQSNIGPNVVDVLEYIIDNWTDLEYDPTCFDAVRVKVDPFPCGFAVFDRPNTMSLLKDISFQARCALWIQDGVFHIKYLPEEPAADKNITVSDIELGSIEVSTTSTEDVVTKLTALYRVTYAPDKEQQKIILRHNVKKYGTKEREVDFFIYNHPQIVHHVATFWMIRWSNTWKKIRFRAFLNMLDLETFDTVNLQLGVQGYVAATDVRAIVEKADYESDSNTLQFECLTPVKFGSASQYKFFWPASLTADDTFPTQVEIDAGYSGGGFYGGDTGAYSLDGVGALAEQVEDRLVWIGGVNTAAGPGSDWGKKRPTDVGFVAADNFGSGLFAEVDTTPMPDLDLSLNYVDPPLPPSLPGNPAAPIMIDIRRTKVVDSDAGGDRVAHLDSIVREINASDDLVIDTGAKFGDGTNEETFDFEFDGDGGKFGAGTAFLKD